MASAERATVRCFIAVELPEAVKRSLAAIQVELQRRMAVEIEPAAPHAVRWVSAEEIHLTLQFLGNVDGELLPAMEESLRRELAGLSPFSVAIAGTGMFPTATRPRVIWVGVGGNVAALAEAKRRVERATTSFGFAAEQRPFNPHLTLGRIREDVTSSTRRALGAAVASTPSSGRFPAQVLEVSLMRSELSPKGARYSRIAAVALS